MSSRYFSNDDAPTGETPGVVTHDVTSWAFGKESEAKTSGVIPETEEDLDDAQTTDSEEAEGTEEDETDEEDGEQDGEDSKTDEEGSKTATPEWVKVARNESKLYRKDQEEWGDLNEYRAKARDLTRTYLDSESVDEVITGLKFLSPVRFDEVEEKILAEKSVEHIARLMDITPDVLAERVKLPLAQEIKISEDLEVAMAALGELKPEFEKILAQAALATRLQKENAALVQGHKANLQEVLDITNQQFGRILTKDVTAAVERARAEVFDVKRMAETSETMANAAFNSLKSDAVFTGLVTRYWNGVVNGETDENQARRSKQIQEKVQIRMEKLARENGFKLREGYVPKTFVDKKTVAKPQSTKAVTATTNQKTTNKKDFNPWLDTDRHTPEGRAARAKAVNERSRKMNGR